MYATIKDVDKALMQVNTAFSAMGNTITQLEERIKKLEANQPVRRASTKKEAENDA